MAKKSMKEAAAAGTSVFDQIATGNAQGVQDAQDVKDEQDAQSVQSAPKKPVIPMERLNLKIPAEIKEYLTIAAAKESIAQRRNISLTEYLCGLVRADMERHKDD